MAVLPSANFVRRFRARVRVDAARALLIAVVLLGAGARAGWSLYAAPEPLYGDSYTYANVAKNIAAGDGYAANHNNVILEPPDTPKPTAFFPPAYSTVIAGVWKAFGVSTASAQILNALLGAATIPFVYAIGRKLFGAGAGISAAALFAVLPNAVVWTPAFLSEHLFTLLFAAGIWALVCLPRGWAAAVAFGAIVALAALTRGQAILLLPAAALFWLQRDGWRAAITSTAAALFVTALLIAPWAARNWAVLHEPIAVSSNAGMDLRVGHSPEANGTFQFSADPIDGVASWDAPTRPDWEARGYRVYTQRAVRYALSHPRNELALAKEKVWHLYQPEFATLFPVLTWTDSGSLRGVRTHDILSRLIDVSWCVVLSMALASLALFWRKGPEHALIAWLVVFWTLFHIVFFGLPRFHLPLVPLLAVAAAGGVWQAVTGARLAFAQRRGGPRAVAGAVSS